MLMSLSLCVLFIRYNMATFLSSFFPNYAEDVNITSTSSGAIFSAYPIGMFLTSLVATRMIIRMGLKNSILLGMYVFFKSFTFTQIFNKLDIQPTFMYIYISFISLVTHSLIHTLNQAIMDTYVTLEPQAAQCDVHSAHGTRARSVR